MHCPRRVSRRPRPRPLLLQLRLPLLLRPPPPLLLRLQQPGLGQEILPPVATIAAAIHDRAASKRSQVTPARVPIRGARHKSPPQT